jgi:hypothetical protein
VVAVCLGGTRKNDEAVRRWEWRLQQIMPGIGLLMAGYLLVSWPWVYRNLNIFGSWMPPGGDRALWITDYDELYAFPGEVLTITHWLQTGWLVHLNTRLWAVSQNLQSVLGVQGLIFLVPLILLGLWQFQKDRRVQLAGLAWAITFIIMSLVFPYQGVRGGLFHSGAVFQPLWWALVPIGLETVIAWGERRRGWKETQARRILSGGLILLAAGLTTLVSIPRLIGSSRTCLGTAEARYERLDQELRDLGIDPGTVILVNNPPGFYAATGRPAIAIPDGSLQTSLAAAKRYKAGYLVLEKDHPGALESVYRFPESYNEGLVFLGSYEGAHVFEVLIDGEG